MLYIQYSSYFYSRQRFNNTIVGINGYSYYAVYEFIRLQYIIILLLYVY